MYLCRFISRNFILMQKKYNSNKGRPEQNSDSREYKKPYNKPENASKRERKPRVRPESSDNDSKNEGASFRNKSFDRPKRFNSEKEGFTSDRKPRFNAANKESNGNERNQDRPYKKSFDKPRRTDFDKNDPTQEKRGRFKSSDENRKFDKGTERPARKSFDRPKRDSSESEGAPYERKKRFDKPFENRSIDKDAAPFKRKSFDKPKHTEADSTEFSEERKSKPRDGEFKHKRPFERKYEPKAAFDPSKAKPRPKPEVKKGKPSKEKEEETLMPLNKYLSHSGVSSRREAAEIIKEGTVTVNGEVITNPGHKVKASDEVVLNDKKLAIQKGMVYILLNKPKDYITTTEDPQGRKTVMQLVENAEGERLFPVGRLDRNTTGLLLITNDGILTQKLSHPSYKIKKIYQVVLDKDLTKADFEKILAGVTLEDGVAPVDALAYLEKKNELGIEIHSGRNRVVRRIFESLGYVVEKLDRVMYAGLTKKNLPRGKWRYLSEKEVILLKHFKS